MTPYWLSDTKRRLSILPVTPSLERFHLDCQVEVPDRKGWEVAGTLVDHV